MDGSLTRGLITGDATFLGGILHALPFLLSELRGGATAAVVVVVALEIVAITWTRHRFSRSRFAVSLLHVSVEASSSSQAVLRSAAPHSCDG